jgi:hypothetical protein
VVYVFGWRFLDDWQLDSSIRYVSTREEGDHFNLWGPSVVLKVPVRERWNVHAEDFGVFSDGRAEGRNPQYFSPGVHSLNCPDFEVSVRSGWELNDDAAHFFRNVGLRWWFRRTWSSLEVEPRPDTRLAGISPPPCLGPLLLLLPTQSSVTFIVATASSRRYKQETSVAWSPCRCARCSTSSATRGEHSKNR